MNPLNIDALLTLQHDGSDRFRSSAGTSATGRHFGGHLLALAVRAGLETVGTDSRAHSLHALFLQSGDRSRPVTLAVERLRDGRSYSTRRVVAEQDGRCLLDARLSCQPPAHGLSFAAPMPDLPAPETLRSEEDVRQEALRRTDVRWVGSVAMGGMGVELRPVHPRDFAEPRKMPPFQHFWFRFDHPIGKDPELQQAALTYVSDMMLLSTTLLPHGIYWSTTPMDSASLDHSVWYHAEPYFDDWMLWSIETPWSGGERGLALGRFYRRDGTMVATVAQEGLIRVREVAPAEHKTD
jgi:acyl-CoA thioesterase-2